MNLVAGGFEYEMRSAFHYACQARDINLHIIYGRAIDPGCVESKCHNTIFDSANLDTIDAALVMATSVSTFCGVSGLMQFLSQFIALPLVAIGLPLPGIPSVVVNSADAVSAIVEHVIIRHRRRRIVFIGGTKDNPEAIERRLAFERTLAKHNVPLEPTLVTCGNFLRTGGEQVITQLLSHGDTFDAVVAANDSMALGATDALRSHGRRYAGRISLTGFDDIVAARVCNPPLTTANQPFDKIAHAAIELVLGLLDGKSVAERIEIPATVVYRTSCGCPDVYELSHAGGQSRGSSEGAVPQTVQRARLAETLAEVFEGSGPDAKHFPQLLLNALEQQRVDNGNGLLAAVEAIVESAPTDAWRILSTDRAVRILRSASENGVGNPLWHVLRDYLARSASAAQMQIALELHAMHLKLGITNERLSGVLELPALTRALESCLEIMRFKSVVVARTVNGGFGDLEVLLSMRDGQVTSKSLVRVNASEVLDVLHSSEDSPQTTLVFPLVMGEMLLGVAVFVYEVQHRSYVQFRDQLAVALRNVALHDSLVAQTLLTERSAQERQATANRLQAMSMLAGSVAHDLNNALGPLVALPDILERELTSWEIHPTQKGEFVTDITTIRAASMRAAQIVKDLLTLGRQGKTAKSPLDLNLVVRRCVELDIARAKRVETPDAIVNAEYAPDGAHISGSEAQLTRAISNLIRNAVESIVADGVVSVSVTIEALPHQMVGFERIEPGTYAVVRIRDNGVGIPRLQLSKIFEPYFSNKRANSESGTGLGLAIVHGVVKEHDGFIDVISQVGQGTTFALYFPVTAERARTSVSCPPIPLASARIWVVDDDPVQLRTARRVMTALGYKVETFDWSQSLLAELQRFRELGQRPCDLILLDMCLGEDQDGLALLDQVHQLFPAQRAMIVSGHAASERMRLAEYKGLTWLVKPYTTVSLSKAIALALRQAQPS